MRRALSRGDASLLTTLCLSGCPRVCRRRLSIARGQLHPSRVRHSDAAESLPRLLALLILLPWTRRIWDVLSWFVAVDGPRRPGVLSCVCACACTCARARVVTCDTAVITASLHRSHVRCSMILISTNLQTILIVYLHICNRIHSVQTVDVRFPDAGSSSVACQQSPPLSSSSSSLRRRCLAQMLIRCTQSPCPECL